MKYCSKCGKECQDNASFCENCGQKLTFQNLSSIEYSDKSKLACGLLQIFLGRTRGWTFLFWTYWYCDCTNFSHNIYFRNWFNLGS